MPRAWRKRNVPKIPWFISDKTKKKVRSFRTFFLFRHKLFQFVLVPYSTVNPKQKPLPFGSGFC